MQLTIIIPCFNEVENMPKLESELFPFVIELVGSCSIDGAVVDAVEVIFVDDGSRDGTWEALNETFSKLTMPGVSVRFKRHYQNQGLGAALRTGFNASRGEIVLTTDSDATYAYSSIPDLLTCLSENVEIVTASPYHPKGSVAGVPAHRLILSRSSSFIYRLLVNRRIHTYTALFRAYRREVIETISFSSNGFLAGTELMVKGMLIGYRVVEYPTVLKQRTYGVSKAKLIKTILAHLQFQGWVFLYRLHLVSIDNAKHDPIGDQQWA